MTNPKYLISLYFLKKIHVDRPVNEMNLENGFISIYQVFGRIKTNHQLTKLRRLFLSVYTIIVKLLTPTFL
jgi:hypothetical protein